MSTIERNSIKFVWNFNLLLSVWKLDESSHTIRKKNLTWEKNLKAENNPPDWDKYFFLRKTLPCWDREKRSATDLTFRRDRFRTLTIVDSTSSWLSLILTSIEDPWLCTDWLSEIKLCKKTRVDGYQLAYAGLNGDISQVCKAGKTKYSGFSKIWNSTYQTYREPSLENNIKNYEIIKTKINFGD